MIDVDEGGLITNPQMHYGSVVSDRFSQVGSERPDRRAIQALEPSIPLDFGDDPDEAEEAKEDGGGPPGI